MSSDNSSKHPSLAFFDLLNGNMIIPSMHMVHSHIRGLMQVGATIKANRELLLSALSFLDLQEKQIDNMLAFWEPIIEDMEQQAATQGESSKNN